MVGSADNVAYLITCTIRSLIAEALSASSCSEPAIVTAAVRKLEDARHNMEQLNRFTTFSRWYKGEHGQARTALIKACKELMLALKTSTCQPDILLRNAVKEYCDYVSSKGHIGSQYKIGSALKDWWTAKAS